MGSALHTKERHTAVRDVGTPSLGAQSAPHLPGRALRHGTMSIPTTAERCSAFTAMAVVADLHRAFLIFAQGKALTDSVVRSLPHRTVFIDFVASL